MLKKEYEISPKLQPLFDTTVSGMGVDGVYLFTYFKNTTKANGLLDNVGMHNIISQRDRTLFACIAADLEKEVTILDDEVKEGWLATPWEEEEDLLETVSEDDILIDAPEPEKEENQ